MKTRSKMALAAAALAAGGAWIALDANARARAIDAWQRATGTTTYVEEARPPRPRRPGPNGPTWDGVLEIPRRQQDEIGVRVEPVKAQTEATELKLSGTTDYDPNTLTIVRTQFDSRVDKILVELGSTVKAGDPLLELFSNTLAEAKSVYETAQNQWARDKKVLDYKAPLAKSGTLPGKELIDAENDEAKSREAMKLARDKLSVFGLTDKEIDAAVKEEGVRKARMEVRSRTNGVVIKRGVVPGNFYDPKDDLLVIAPLEHLWVRGNVSEIDADKVQVGQSLRVVFPYSHKTVAAKVEYIDKAIDPDTRAAKFRTSIPNPGKSLKSGAYVRVVLEIPPEPGQTIIPRVAMVSVDRHDYVFIRKAGTVDRYERRAIVLIKESNDFVIVAEPTRENPCVKPGEDIVTTGSLILEQMYEDRLMVEDGILP